MESLEYERKLERGRFALGVPDDCDSQLVIEGRYVNLDRAWSGVGFVQCTPGRVTFVEKTSSDNLFVLSIFADADPSVDWKKGFKPGERYPALMAVQIWQPEVRRFPATRVGYCRPVP